MRLNSVPDISPTCSAREAKSTLSNIKIMYILGMIEIEILLNFVYFLECTVVQCKDALSIYWNRHGHECSRICKLSANFTLIQCIKMVSRFFGPRYIRDDIYLGPNLVSFNQTLMISLSRRRHIVRVSQRIQEVVLVNERFLVPASLIWYRFARIHGRACFNRWKEHPYIVLQYTPKSTQK
jgi:hypothetical protein